MFNRNQISIAVAAVVSVQGAVAQSEHNREVHALRGGDFAIEEVMVTARKREESLQTVPVAVDVLTSVQLEEKGIAGLEGVARYTPGLDFETGLMPNDTRISLRGLSNTRGRSNVALLIDGVDVSSESLTTGGSGNGPNLDLFDLERVEVVKGPQSAVYGRSAFSGAVNYVTKRPGDTAESRVAMDLTEHGYNKLQAGGSMPIVPGVLAASLNLARTEFDGYYQNPNTGGDLGTIDSDGVAVAVNWTPTEKFSAYMRGEYSEAEYSQRPNVQRQAILHTGSSPYDFTLLGSVSPNAEKRAIAGTGTTAADCATTAAYQYMVSAPGTPACGAVLVGELGSADESEIDLSPNPLTGKDFPGTEVRGARASLELNYKADAFEFLSLTGVNYNDSRTQSDFDRTNFTVESLGPGSGMFVPPGFPGEYTQYGVNSNSDTSFDVEQLSQEFRLTGTAGKVDWLASALYWAESMDTVMNQQWWLRDGVSKEFWDAYLDQWMGGFGLVDHRTTPVPLPIPMSRDTDHVSVAFSLNYNFTDNWRLTAEGRYLEEDIKYGSIPLSTQFNGLMGVPVLDPVTFMPTEPEAQTYSRTDSAFVPRVGLDWQAMDSLMVYASYSEGFKPGGMSTADGNGDISVGEYEPEELSVYEAGFKSNLLSNRLQLNGAAYLYDYTNQQISHFVTDPQSGMSNAAVANAGESELRGMELSAIYRPSANWTFVANYVLSDTEVVDFTIAEHGRAGTLDKLWTQTADGDYSGTQFLNSAKHAGLLSIRYDGEFANGAGYFTELVGTYESERYLDRGNNAWLPAYWLMDFQGGVSFDSLDLVFYVNNLLDDDKVKFGLNNVDYGFLPGGATTPQTIELILPEPRTAGLRVSYKF
ncbi:TonB-dependent receptor [Microbulbifer hydrolyticus]|uniref:Outer membrane receptor protein involved in Fe transport n=1 Tax=Microbulbifer hydrolyticus TaxID=48074 RepID=A0A6P1T948_9GAMM|nr:TonB-dependent receptor [Microbulbifer hydrolyticus]MBB5210157.1 outer membrane receptor protein involved in Fe transport [Microbulbifer hydrolyticus]QHQ39328.1 TonB-dependent receptor [Microbulbifer hydrolyticus]